MELSPTTDAISKINIALLGNQSTFGGNASGTGNYSLRLGQNLLTPGEIGNWKEADFNGYAPNNGGVGFGNGIDPVLGHPTLTLLPPAGGFRWVTGAGFNGSQTIKSVRIDHIVSGYTIATGILSPEQTVTAIGDQINMDAIQVTIIES